MNDNEIRLVVLLLMLFASVCGIVVEWRYVRYQAVKHGAAEWRIDKYGNRSIHWRDAE